MKTITVKQPWASLIVEGVKDIENRTWKTNFRGRVLIHAGATPCGNLKADSCFSHILTNEQYSRLLRIGLERFGTNEKADICWLNLYPHGAIIGSVEIVDCVINHPSIWSEKTPLDKQLENKCIWNWVFANPIMFDNPIPCKGKLSFWDYNEDVL